MSINSKAKEGSYLKKKTKKDLWELAMLYRYELGGFRYKKEYTPMVELAYKYDTETLKKMEKQKQQEFKKIFNRKNEYIKKHGIKWTKTLNQLIIEIGNNAGETLDISYAIDLVELHRKKYLFYNWRRK